MGKPEYVLLAEGAMARIEAEVERALAEYRAQREREGRRG